jgi:hypothetical protein
MAGQMLKSETLMQAIGQSKQVFALNVLLICCPVLLFEEIEDWKRKELYVSENEINE